MAYCAACLKPLSPEHPEWDLTVNLTPDILAVGLKFFKFEQSLDASPELDTDWCTLNCFARWLAAVLGQQPTANSGPEAPP